MTIKNLKLDPKVKWQAIAKHFPSAWEVLKPENEPVGAEQAYENARKELNEAIRRMRPDYAFHALVKIRMKDGKPHVTEEDTEDFYEDLVTLFLQGWMDEYSEPRYSEFILNVTETAEFEALTEEGLYEVWQVGSVTIETSRDWETGEEDLDGYIYEPLFTHFSLIEPLDDKKEANDGKFEIP